MATLFTAISSSARQLQLLLRCISFAKKAQVRITPDGLRFSTAQGSAMEAFVFLDKSLFTSFNYNNPPLPSFQDDPPLPPVFEINLNSLLETLNIFSLSDPAISKRPGNGFSDLETHRLHRHGGLNAFSPRALGTTGQCTISYAGPGHPLSVHMAEAGVTTTCNLTTYDAPHAEDEIPFRRDTLALKTIMPATQLLDAISELASLNPAEVTIRACPLTSSSTVARSYGASAIPNLSLAAAGALGEATVDFTASAPDSSRGAADTSSNTGPLLETFQCDGKVAAQYKFVLVKAAQRAMQAAAKVSMRIDGEGVLSLQFLVEVEEGGGSNGAAGGEGRAFVDFRVVPLVEGEGYEMGEEESE